MSSQNITLGRTPYLDPYYQSTLANEEGAAKKEGFHVERDASRSSADLSNSCSCKDVCEPLATTSGDSRKKPTPKQLVFDQLQKTFPELASTEENESYFKKITTPILDVTTNLDAPQETLNMLDVQERGMTARLLHLPRLDGKIQILTSLLKCISDWCGSDSSELKDQLQELLIITQRQQQQLSAYLKELERIIVERALVEGSQQDPKKVVTSKYGILLNIADLDGNLSARYDGVVDEQSATPPRATPSDVPTPGDSRKKLTPKQLVFSQLVEIYPELKSEEKNTMFIYEILVPIATVTNNSVASIDDQLYLGLTARLIHLPSLNGKIAILQSHINFISECCGDDSLKLKDKLQNLLTATEQQHVDLEIQLVGLELDYSTVYHEQASVQYGILLNEADLENNTRSRYDEVPEAENGPAWLVRANGEEIGQVHFKK